MHIQMIPLTQLRPSRSNVRKIGAKTGIDELAASIAAHGLLQNLQVRAIADGTFEVVAGARRFAALKLLAKRKKLAADTSIGCNLLDAGTGAGQDAEISLAENEMRQAMHPADQFTAFKALVDNGTGVEDIAARFGVAPLVVRQRLKLASVSPVLFALYREGAMTLDQLMAFTVSDDFAAQEAAWFDGAVWNRSSHALRRTLTAAHVEASDRRARFVGLDIYVAAGGPLVKDLFAAEDEGYLADPALLDRLVAERLEREADSVRQEGWRWVEIIPDLAYDTLSRYGRVKGKARPLPAREAKAQAKALAKAEKALEALHEQDELTEEEADRLDALDAEVEALSTPVMVWSDRQMARAGAVVGIAPNGALAVTRGLLKPSEAKAVSAEAEAGSEIAPSPPRATGLSAKLVADLTAHRTAAVRALLADAPEVALVALVHALALPVFYGSSAETGLDLRAGDPVLRAEGIEDSPAAKQLAERQAAWAAQLPEAEDALWDWLRTQDTATLTRLMALCLANTVDPIIDTATDRLAAALTLDMTQWWQPTAAGYLGRVSKGLIAEAVTEGVNASAANNIAAMKKDAMAKRAEELLAGTGWLPGMLRSVVPVAGEATEVLEANEAEAVTDEAA
jgi:ParB family chromosome partitioning protein